MAKKVLYPHIPGGAKQAEQLPTFKGYTVDMRLRQFRKADFPRPMEFIDFDSPKGEQLYLEYVRSMDRGRRR